jgi:hypothetical protein
MGQYVAADDERIFGFIEEVEALPRNNQLIEFRHSDEIAGHLREQWAGLFQRFLQEQEQFPDRRAADDLHTALKTVNQLVTFLTNERREHGSAINEILLSNHPLFERIREETKTPYPVFFRTRAEMEAWLAARSWEKRDVWDWNDPELEEWITTNRVSKVRTVLRIARHLFEDDRLRIYTPTEWEDQWIQAETLSSQEETPFSLDDDDDLPF